MALEKGSHKQEEAISGSSQKVSTEGLGGKGAREIDREWRRSGEKIDAEGISGNESPHYCPGGDAATGTTDTTDKAPPPLAKASAHHKDVEQKEEEAEGTEGSPHNQASVVALKGRGGLSGGSVEAVAASEQQPKAREQAKRLALEVARLRSSLRATVSELNMERSARVRIEDEWWKKMGDWEEERGCLVASKQEAERLSTSADKDLARVLAESKAREAKAAAECVARETAQHKADSVMKHVLKVQDRLVQALQTEVSLTNRAREAAEDDARETNKQLRLYVQDFLLWRDRAKRLEAREADNEIPTPQQHTEGVGTEPATTAAILAATAGSPEHAGSTQTGRNDEPSDESIPEKYARYFETDTDGYPAAPLSAARFCLQEVEDPKEGSQGTETDTAAAAAAAAAWSTRLAMVGSPSASSSRVHFQQSMKAQQAASARLEKDLMKARADLQSIYAGSRTADIGGSGRGGGKAMRAGLWPGAQEGLRMALSEGTLEADGDGNESIDNCQPDSPTTDEKRGGGAFIQGKARESVATHVVEGSHLARVLAVLLGGDPAAAAAGEAGRVPDAPSLALRLTDFPPALQAVFGEGPAATPPDAAFENRTVGSKGVQERRGEASLKQQQRRRWARESPLEIGQSDVGLAGKAAGNEQSGSYPAATIANGQVRAGGCGRMKEDRREGLHSAGGASTVSGAAEEWESCSLGGTFQGYRARSSLLQRWLAERVSPPLSQSDA